MRLPFILPLLLLAACSDPAFRPISEPDAEEEGQFYTISGIVLDSVSGQAIAGARVAAGPFVDDADAAGQWSLKVPAGLTTVTTSPVGYERSSFTFKLVANSYVDLQARRLAPIVQECVRDGDLVRARISDLQGRKTVERWEKSEAFIRDPAGTYRIGAAQWVYLPLDYVTWQVTLGPIAPEVASVQWNVYDSEGHKFSGSCEPAPIVTGE